MFARCQHERTELKKMKEIRKKERLAGGKRELVKSQRQTRQDKTVL